MAYGDQKWCNSRWREVVYASALSTKAFQATQYLQHHADLARRETKGFASAWCVLTFTSYLLRLIGYYFLHSHSRSRNWLKIFFNLASYPSRHPILYPLMFTSGFALWFDNSINYNVDSIRIIKMHPADKWRMWAVLRNGEEWYCFSNNQSTSNRDGNPTLKNPICSLI